MLMLVMAGTSFENLNIPISKSRICVKVFESYLISMCTPITARIFILLLIRHYLR